MMQWGPWRCTIHLGSWIVDCSSGTGRLLQNSAKTRIKWCMISGSVESECDCVKMEGVESGATENRSLQILCNDLLHISKYFAHSLLRVDRIPSHIIRVWVCLNDMVKGLLKCRITVHCIDVFFSVCHTLHTCAMQLSIVFLKSYICIHSKWT